MTTWIRLAAIAAALIPLLSHGEPVPQRPDLAAAKPLATCKLEVVAAPEASPAMPAMVQLYATQPVADDGAINYLRTPRGEWQLPERVDRDDPWNRILMLSPKRPIVIDLAVFLDGKPYRAARENWIDEVLTAGKSKSGDAAAAAPKSEKLVDEEEKTTPTAGTSDDAEPSNEQATSVATENKDAAAEKDTAAEKKEEAKEPVIATVAPQARVAPSIRDRLMIYLESMGSGVSREEIRWLLAEWGSGPPLVVLGPGLSWQRASTAPLLAYLDQNKDGNLSKEEIAGIENHLMRADADANDVLEIREVRRADERPLASPNATGHPLLVTLDETTNWKSLANDIAKIYGPEVKIRDAKLAGDDFQRLLDGPADVTLRVDFAAADGAPTGVSILELGPGLSQIKDAITANEDVITLDLGADYIEISASGGGSISAESGGSQVAVGAVIDGDPLLRVIDRDQDGRLTSREREDLRDFVRGFDRNSDGQASSDEIPIPIRFAVTHGPVVHQLLATARPAARIAKAAPTAAVAAPAWFASADKNGDADLSPDEFLGTPEQFRQFDVDGDRRLSIAEAVAAGGGE